MSALLPMLTISSCATETFVTTVTTATSVTTTVEEVETAETFATASSTVVATTVAGASVSSSTTITAVASTTSLSTVNVAPTTTVVAASRPKLYVSQTSNLNPNGTSVTVRGTGYDVKKGVYVIVCSQAAPGPQATCIGGVNIDGSSSSSVWVSSNPPNYAVGLTTPFLPDGSFIIDLVVVAKSGALDCTVLKCGVVTRSDHLRYTDRTQDVFVPISFSN